MKQGRQRAPLWGALLLVLILWARSCVPLYAQESDEDNNKKFGDKCRDTKECAFEGAVCDDITFKCLCRPDLPVTNHIDKCGTPARVNESCFFNEQCETTNFQTECKEGVCTCRYDKLAVMKPDGKIECEVVQTKYSPEKYIDPAMIGILVAMFLMFITICVVLRLFSKARWRENRTIFNTPNPRLMNVSLLKENKHLHERRGSRNSRGPSRQPSIASLRAHSPNSQGRLFLGSRRGSRGSSNVSAASTKSNKSPPQALNLNSATTPMLESVTVEIQEPKA
ncbi:uncharacterized protein LOC130896227 isoform X1 [Diorhabda carinulata]|uniref:uncharacterized protein LOC130896227 isoform X1 n=1 Tax=Diorhabda carinulata TaxID=1163345 RepID=UPI0025A30868|nr:uncharacterized protein LOC130896227 isoform X1 [Diorhabda carinulata]